MLEFNHVDVSFMLKRIPFIKFQFCLPGQDKVHIFVKVIELEQSSGNMIGFWVKHAVQHLITLAALLDDEFFLLVWGSEVVRCTFFQLGLGTSHSCLYVENLADIIVFTAQLALFGEVK